MPRAVLLGGLDEARRVTDLDGRSAQSSSRPSSILSSISRPRRRLA